MRFLVATRFARLAKVFYELRLLIEQALPLLGIEFDRAFSFGNVYRLNQRPTAKVEVFEDLRKLCGLAWAEVYR